MMVPRQPALHGVGLNGFEKDRWMNYTRGALGKESGKKGKKRM
jgi:hypothetical protein